MRGASLSAASAARPCDHGAERLGSFTRREFLGRSDVQVKIREGPVIGVDQRGGTGAAILRSQVLGSEIDFPVLKPDRLRIIGKEGRSRKSRLTPQGQQEREYPH